MDNGIHLDGLDGSNPMGFLAALGALVCAGKEARIEWTQSAIPTPVLYGINNIQILRDCVLDDLKKVQQSQALNYKDGKASLKEVKFSDPMQTRNYLESAIMSDDQGLSAAISTSLICEVSVAGNGSAKPSDLHFMSGNQRLIKMARELADKVLPEMIDEAILGPWKYENQAPSFMWDTSDDRNYALRATNPSGSSKMTVPGADWLAFRGLTLLPVVGKIGRTATPGAVGSWKNGKWRWPLWEAPLASQEITVLLGSEAVLNDKKDPPAGVFQVFESQIIRSDQGGYGTFRPPALVWTAAVN